MLLKLTLMKRQNNILFFPIIYSNVTIVLQLSLIDWLNNKSAENIAVHKCRLLIEKRELHNHHLVIIHSHVQTERESTRIQH